MANQLISDLSAGTISGTQLLFNGNPSTGALTKNTFTELQTFLGAPQVYAAIFSQSGSSAPANDFSVANTTGKTFSWARTSAGLYTLTASGSFFTGLTICLFNANNAAFGFIITHTFTDSVTLTINVRSLAGSLVDSALDHACIKLEHYS